MNEIEVIGGLAMHNSWVMLAAAALLWLAWMARWRPCRCEKCAFHQNEARVERLKQAERKHDALHKGFGYTQSTPDLYKCSDPECYRNKSIE